MANSSKNSARDALSELLLRTLSPNPELKAKQLRLLQKLGDASNDEPRDGSKNSKPAATPKSGKPD